MRHKSQSNAGIPSWSRPWAAGWTAMSDVARIEVDSQRNGESTLASAPARPRHLRAIGLAVVAIATGLSVSAVVWL